MGLDTFFVKAQPTDTVSDVLDRIAAQEAEKEDMAVAWLVIPLEPPWQYAVLDVAELGQVAQADWDKELKDTAVAQQWELATIVPQEVVELGEAQAVRMALNNQPSEVLLVHGVVGVFTEETLPGCRTTCPEPDCARRQRAAGDGAIVTCRGTCGKRFEAVCGDVGKPLD